MKFLPHSVSRVAVAAGAVLVLGGSAVGIAVAQTQPAPTPNAQQGNYQKFLDALAKRLNISTQQLQTDVSQARQDAGLPANGGFGGGRPGGPGGPGGQGGPGGPRPGFARGLDLNTAAQAIGITPQQLRQELPGKSVAQVAGAHGKNGNDVATALKNAANGRIDQAVTSGRLTSDQGNTQKTAVDARIDTLVNQVMPQGGQGGPRPGAPGGPGRVPGGPGGFGPGIIQQGLNVAAQAIGITPQQLQQELSGKSLAQVASAHGKTGDDVATALKKAANTRIDQAVSSGQLTSDQGNTQKSNIGARIDTLVKQVMPQGGFQRGGGQGGQQQDQTGA
jgi:hypothetical protein